MAAHSALEKSINQPTLPTNCADGLLPFQQVGGDFKQLGCQVVGLPLLTLTGSR